MILDKHITFVNEQLAFHKSRAAIYQAIPARQRKHQETADKFQSLSDDLESVKEQIASSASVRSPATKQLKLALTPDDLNGLPDELIGELSIASVDRVEVIILSMLDDAGGMMTLDQILIGLYRKSGEVNKRQTITSRLYRMGQKNLIYSVPGKKGVYSLQRLSEEEAYKLFGRSLEEDA